MTTNKVDTAPEQGEMVATTEPAGPILVGVDGSPEAAAAARYAVQLAGTSGGTLLLVSCAVDCLDKS